MKRIIIFVLFGLAAVTSCSVLRQQKCYTENYIIKVRQIVLPFSSSPFLCCDVCFTPSSCVIYKIDRNWKYCRTTKSYQNIDDTTYIGSYQLSEVDSVIVDSLNRRLWSFPDTNFKGASIDGNINIINLKDACQFKTIKISACEIDEVDRLYDVVNNYCRRAKMPTFMSTKY